MNLIGKMNQIADTFNEYDRQSQSIEKDWNGNTESEEKKYRSTQKSMADLRDRRSKEARSRKDGWESMVKDAA